MLIHHYVNNNSTIMFPITDCSSCSSAILSCPPALLVHQLLLAGKADLTSLALGSDDKVVLALHVSLGSWSKSRSTTLLEEESRAESKFHVGKVNTETAVGASAKGRVGLLCDFGDFR